MTAKQNTHNTSDKMSTPYVSRPLIARLIVLFFLVLLPLGVFGKITFDIARKDPIDFDVSIQNFVHTLSSPWLDTVSEVLTNFGSANAIMIITAIIIVYLLFIHRRRMATILLFGVGGAAALNLIVKSLFERSRPELWQHLVVENSYSFPSGHAMASSALAASVIVILWQTKWRWLALVAGSLYILIIGLTRVYLGVHYPSDVIAGWCMSLLWVLAVKTIVDRYRTHASTSA